MINQCESKNIVQIIRGSDRTFFINLFYEDTGEPFDLTSASEIIVSFPPASTTVKVEEKLSTHTVSVIGAPGAGKIQVTCDAADTTAMSLNPTETEYQDLQVEATVGGLVSIFLIPDVLDIKDPFYAV